MNGAVPMHSRVEWLLSNLLKVLEVLSKQNERSQGGFSSEKARGPRREKKRQLHLAVKCPRILMRTWVVSLSGIVPFVGLPVLLPSRVMLINSHSVRLAPSIRSVPWVSPGQF